MSVDSEALYGAIDGAIAQINQRLKIARLGVQLERRSTKLNLRATLPPRPDSSRVRPYQQRLSLGLPATKAGLKQAEQEAKVIAAQLIQNAFDWKDYQVFAGGKRLCQMNLTEQLAAFEQFFFEQPDRLSSPSSAKTTWTAAYAPYLKKLATIAASNAQLTIAEAIYKTVQSQGVNSRSRQVCCTALSALAKFLNLELPTELKHLWGGYGDRQMQIRQLPTDEEILATWEKIPNPAWQFVYGIMATYGLRNHEVFFCDYSTLSQNETRVQVLPTTKTGTHEVWAFYPEWIEEFDLKNICLPEIETDLTKTTLQTIGQRVTAQFRRYEVPFSPYDLRHAWAVRTIHFGLPDTVAARMMGHSVSVHTRTYHQWISRRDQQQAVEAALQRNGVVAPRKGEG
ncbi:MAG: site-specific integrase [Leptolyngbyaceae cyanobacterium CSU_1_3]|nr:site-specific integrase [Leptolyngbyaceae cyanobacterium CSU_1_3]